MAKITNAKELEEERQRLLILKNEQEIVFKGHITAFQNKIAPYRSLFENADNLVASGKGSGKVIQNLIQLGIPLLIDRYLLGTKGLVIKKVATWASQFAAVRLSQENPNELVGKIIRFIPQIGNIPFLKNIFHKRTQKEAVGI